MGGIIVKMQKKIQKANRESGSRLKGVRIQRNLTQEEFADEFGISVSALKKLESGENGISTKRLRQLKTMNISSDFILFGDEPDGDKILTELECCSKTKKLEIMISLIKEYAKERNNAQTMSNEQLMDTIKAILDKG